MKIPFYSRKTTRLENYNYNTPGFYFITICTQDKKKLLCNIVGTGVLDGPKCVMHKYGEIAKKHIENMKDFYSHITIKKYVIMPNHIHFLIQIHNKNILGPSRTPVPTNTYLSQFISTFKRFCNKEIGKNIWQYRSHDHVIRDQKDYLKICNYINHNPSKWKQDCFYTH